MPPLRGRGDMSISAAQSHDTSLPMLSCPRSSPGTGTAVNTGQWPGARHRAERFADTSHEELCVSLSSLERGTVQGWRPLVPGHHGRLEVTIPTGAAASCQMPTMCPQSPQPPRGRSSCSISQYKALRPERLSHLPRVTQLVKGQVGPAELLLPSLASLTRKGKAWKQSQGRRRWWAARGYLYYAS